jgi:peroxiredoxin
MMTGQDAPDFALLGLDGRMHSLRDARNAGLVLLVFWQAGCGACKMVAPYLTRLHETYENAGWTFWTICQDGPDEAQRFVADRTLAPTVLVDGPTLAVSDLYDPPATPTYYLIGPGAAGVTFVADGFDKEALNEISRTVAEYTRMQYSELAPPDDGNPAFKPG